MFENNNSMRLKMCGLTLQYYGDREQKSIHDIPQSNGRMFVSLYVPPGSIISSTVIHSFNPKKVFFIITLCKYLWEQQEQH